MVQEIPNKNLRFTVLANSGIYRATGSAQTTDPSSTRFINPAATISFVTDATKKPYPLQHKQ
tara:strand:+ start:393 stop:578 length:186 start_codon:yes stop_codon:yes gene_type:complete